MSSWKSLLLRIGDKSPEYGTSSDFKDHIETCFGAIRRELDHYGDEILPFLLQCVEQLPHKTPLYGTLIGLMNLENEDFVKKIVEQTHTNFQDALNSGNCHKIRILLRFLTALMSSKVLLSTSLVVVFETLLSSAATTVDEEKGNPAWQARADFYITCILSCFPWGGAELVEQVPDELERVMVGVEAYLSIRRHTLDTGLSFFEDDGEVEKTLNEKDFLEDLWGRIQVLSSDGWKVDSVPRPHLLFEAQLVAGKSHEFGTISCPEQPDPPSTLSGITYGKQKYAAELSYPQRIRRLNIFPSSKFELVERNVHLSWLASLYLLDMSILWQRQSSRSLDEILRVKGFGSLWRKWIRGCISSTNYSIIINGKPRGKFGASRDLRQGDPLSPFLFILVVDCLSRMLNKAEKQDLIEGFHVGKEQIKTSITHLQFADDTILFSTQDDKKLQNLFQIIWEFERASGLNINCQKTEFLTLGMDPQRAASLATTFGCTLGSWPSTYLGLPLNDNPRTLSFWTPIIEKIEKRLQNWGNTHISKGGRITLIQATLTNLPIYFFSTFLAPTKITKIIEKLYRNFLWRSGGGKGGCHLIKWSIIKSPIEEGGLGVFDIHKRNISLLAKWIWRFHKDQDALWRRVIVSKFGSNDFDLKPGRLSMNTSKGPWKSIYNLQNLVYSNITTNIGRGDQTLFWKDCWMGNQTLQNSHPALYQLSLKKDATVTDLWNQEEGTWNPFLRRNLNDDEFQEWASLSHMLEAFSFKEQADQWRWTLEKEGFSPLDRCFSS